MRTIEECIKELKERRDWESIDEVNAVFDEMLEIHKAEKPKGEWIHECTYTPGGDSLFSCSICNGYISTKYNNNFFMGVEFPQYKFCPFCGAEMEAEE